MTAALPNGRKGASIRYQAGDAMKKCISMCAALLLPGCGMTIGYANSSSNYSSAPTVPIVNSSSPQCSGITIADAGEAEYSGIIPAMFIDVLNSSGQRKWIQADIKYSSETHTALQATAEEWWETSGQLLTREAGQLRFWVKKVPGTPVSNFRMLLVKVIGCGA